MKRAKSDLDRSANLDADDVIKAFQKRRQTMKKREFIRLTQNIEFYSLPEFSYYIHHNVKDAPICTSEGRNIKEHESYSTAVNIYSCDDGLVGVEGVYERFNECSEWVDFGIVCTACEYEAFQTIGYQPKN